MSEYKYPAFFFGAGVVYIKTKDLIHKDNKKLLQDMRRIERQRYGRKCK